MRVAALEAELAGVTEERDALLAENKAVGEHLFGLQQENGLLHDIGWTSCVEKAQLAKKADEVPPMREALGRQGDQLESFQSENARLSAEVEALKSQCSQAQHVVRGMEATLESVRADLAQRISREGSLAERGAALQRQLQEVQGEKANLDRVVSGLHVDLARSQQAYSELQTSKAQAHALGQKLQAAEMEIGRSHAEKTQLDQMASALHVEVAQLKTQRDSSLTEVPNLNGVIQQQNLSITDLQQQISQFHAALQDLQRRNSILEREKNALSHLLDESRSNAANREHTTGALAAERDRLRAAVEDISTKKVAADEHIGAIMGDRSVTNAHLEASNAENVKLQMKVQQLGSDNAALRSRLAGFEKMLVGYKDESAGLHQQVSVLRAEGEELRERAAIQLPQARVAAGGIATNSSWSQQGAL